MKMHCIVTHLMSIKLHSCLPCSLEIFGIIMILRVGNFPSIECCMLCSFFAVGCSSKGPSRHPPTALYSASIFSCSVCCIVVAVQPGDGMATEQPHVHCQWGLVLSLECSPPPVVIPPSNCGWVRGGGGRGWVAIFPTTRIFGPSVRLHHPPLVTHRNTFFGSAVAIVSPLQGNNASSEVKPVRCMCVVSGERCL